MFAPPGYPHPACPTVKYFSIPNASDGSAFAAFLTLPRWCLPLCLPVSSSMFFAFSNCPIAAHSTYPSTTTKRLPDIHPPQRHSRPPAAKPIANPPTSPSTPVKACAPPITCRTTPASYSSLKEHIHQIDLLFPQWLHVDRAAGHSDGHTTATHIATSPLSMAAGVHDPDDADKVKRVIQERQRRHRNLSRTSTTTTPATPGLGRRHGRTSSRIPPRRAVLRQQTRALLHHLSGLSRPFARF